MDLEKIFFLQTQLDKAILENHNLDHKNLFPKKIISLIVELSELANATRCFKYWSLKPPSSKEIILEEFVDSLHFVISLGIEINFIDFKKIQYKNNESPLYEQLLSLYIDINDFLACRNEENFISIFNDLMGMGLAMGFLEEEIFNAYLKKNEINLLRQADGY